MDTPSPKPKSWDRLVRNAQSTPAPAGIDMRAAIRAEIAATTREPMKSGSLLDDVLSVGRSRWLQSSFAALALAAVLACLESRDVVNEIAWICQLQGPVIGGI